MHISHSTRIAAAALGFLGAAQAFYPYQPPGTDGKQRRTPSDVSDHKDTGLEKGTSDWGAPTITLPLRRVPHRRDNKYKIVTATAPKQSNSVGIDQDGTDLSYMVGVTLGDSKETYHLLLDSAASNTWVMGEECKSDACGVHNLFGSSDSKTIKTTTDKFSITYGTGEVSGTVPSDTLHLSSFSPSFSFGIATNVSDQFKSYPMDGIMGLGRGDSTPNTIEAPSLMDVLSTQKLIKSKIVGIHLSRTSSGNNDGELNFGDVNKDRFDGDLNYISANDNSDGFWEIGVDDAGVDGKTISAKGKTAILDSGTSFILMPQDEAAALHKLIPGSSQNGESFTVPCKATQAIQFTFNKKVYNVSAADWIGGDAGSGNCRSNVIGRTTFGANRWLLGDVFLKNVYAALDFDQKRVGLGMKGGDAAKGASSSSASGSPTAAGGLSASPALPTGGSSSNSNPTANSANGQGASASPSKTAGGVVSARVSSLVAGAAVVGILVGTV